MDPSLLGQGGSGGQGGGGPPSMGDTTPPTIVSVSPAEGTSQIIEEAITLVFSEPMDRASVEVAFPTATSFAWTQADSTVRVELPLPFAAVPALYEIRVPVSVKDVAGNTLAAAFEASVVLAALTTLTLPHDQNLSGNQIEGQNGNFTFLEAGDTTADSLRYGAVSFSLAELPALAGTLGLRRATLRLQVLDTEGDPNDAALNGFLLDLVAFTARADIDNPTIVEAEVARLQAPAGFNPGQPVSADITALVQAASTNAEPQLQFRIRAGASSANQVADTVYFRRGADENDSIVGAGVLEPDPANIARIELEYFE